MIGLALNTGTCSLRTFVHGVYQMGELQARYIAQSMRVELQAWRQRPPGMRLLEGAAGLLSPLL